MKMQYQYYNFTVVEMFFFFYYSLLCVFPKTYLLKLLTKDHITIFREKLNTGKYFFCLIFCSPNSYMYFSLCLPYLFFSHQQESFYRHYLTSCSNQFFNMLFSFVHRPVLQLQGTEQTSLWMTPTSGTSGLRKQRLTWIQSMAE